MLPFVGFLLRPVLWLLTEIVDLGNFGRHEGNVDNDPKQDTEWLGFEVVSAERPDLDYQYRKVHARKGVPLVCIITGPRHLEDYSFMLFIFFLNLEQSIDLALSRCRENVCGMKEVSAVCSHRGGRPGGWSCSEETFMTTARGIGWKALPYILPFYLKSPRVLRDSVAFLDRVS